MKNKKIIGMVLFVIALILVVVLSFVLKNKEDKTKKESAFDLLVDTSDMQSIEVDITYRDNENKKVFDMNGKEVEVEIGTNVVLGSSYIDLNERYSVLEMLIGLDGNNGYLNDAQLSTSYDFCSKYAKRWYLVDKVTNEENLLFDNGSYSLILNTKKGEDYLEADYMYLSLGEGIADHLKIPFDDIIEKGTFNETLVLEEYSIFNTLTLDFNPASLISSSREEIDLDGNGIKDKVEVSFYNSSSLTNSSSGFEININGKSKKYPLTNPSTYVNLVDLNKDDNYKELLIGSLMNTESEDFQETYIISYFNDEIITTHHSNDINYIFNIDEDYSFKEKELIFDENGNISYTFLTQDSIQGWHLNASYKLNDEHKLVRVNEDYFKAVEKSIRVVRNNIDIVLYEEMDYDSNKIVIKANSKMKMIGTNLDTWGVIEYEGGILYLPIDNKGYIKGLDAKCELAFEGLAIAG